MRIVFKDDSYIEFIEDHVLTHGKESKKIIKEVGSLLQKNIVHYLNDNNIYYYLDF